MDNILLRFEFLATESRYPVQETLALFPDGQVCLWSTAAESLEDRRRAGTFTLQLNYPRLEEAHQIAQALMALPGDLQQGDFRGAVLESVSVQGEAGIRGHLLNRSQAHPLPVELQPALALRERLLEAVRGAPLAVVELSARQASSGGKPALAFACRSLGSQAVEFLFNPSSLCAWQRGPQGWRRAWQITGELSMGLLGPMGVLVDGLYAPAELAPGAQASLLITLAERLPEADEGYWAALQGEIRLLGPGYEEESSPGTPFVVMSQVGG
jgi:hypothetical protein